MPKYLIKAYLQTEYEIDVEAENEEQALHTLDEWIDEDFQPFKVHGEWDFDVLENE